MDAYLAEFTWFRTTTSVDQLRMRNIRYSRGAAWAHQDVSVTFDPEQRQFVFTQIRAETRKGKEQPQLAPLHRQVKNLSVEDITGLSDALPDLPSRQLMLPFFISYPQANFPHQGA